MKISPLQITSCKNALARILAISFAMLLLVFPACKKEEGATNTQQDQKDFALAVSESDAEAESIFDNAFDNAMGVNNEVAIGGTGVFGRVAAQATGNRVAGTDTITCFTVTVSQATANRFPLKVVIDFGAGCNGNDGKVRKGKIIIVYTGRLVQPGNSASLTFDGYYVDDTKVEGTQTISNTGTQDQKSFTIQVTGARLSKPNGNYTEWNSERTITQTGGISTPILALDDVFTITGKSNGTVKRGDKVYQWTTQTTQPLTKKFACRWITKGTVVLEKGNTTVAVLDYGSGDCDNKASYTVNGVAYEITLR
jgi:hypothetical protein